MIRQFDVAARCNILSESVADVTTWVADPDKIIYNASSNQLSSKYLGFGPIDLLQHSSKTKPWKCQIHIQLFPHKHLIQNMIPFPPITMYNSTDQYFFKIMPSGTPNLKMLISQYELDERIDQRHFVSEIRA